MEYTKDIYEDGTTNERFEGKPDEILQLINGIPREVVANIKLNSDEVAEKVLKELKEDNKSLPLYDTELAISYICRNLDKKINKLGLVIKGIDRELLVGHILDLEEDYMKSIGLMGEEE